MFNLIRGPRTTTWRVTIRPAYRGDRAARRKAAHRGGPSPRTQHPLRKAGLLSPARSCRPPPHSANQKCGCDTGDRTQRSQRRRSCRLAPEVPEGRACPACCSPSGWCTSATDGDRAGRVPSPEAVRPADGGQTAGAGLTAQARSCWLELVCGSPRRHSPAGARWRAALCHHHLCPSRWGGTSVLHRQVCGREGRARPFKKTGRGRMKAGEAGDAGPMASGPRVLGPAQPLHCPLPLGQGQLASEDTWSSLTLERGENSFLSGKNDGEGPSKRQGSPNPGPPPRPDSL